MPDRLAELVAVGNAGAVRCGAGSAGDMVHSLSLFRLLLINYISSPAYPILFASSKFQKETFYAFISIF